MKNYYAHDTAIIEDNVTIGEGTKVWVNSQIRSGARIGKNCIVSKDTFIDSDVVIGDNCKIQNGVSIYHGVTVENRVFIGPNAAFTNDMYPRAFSKNWEVTPTLVKEGASIGANATIVCGITLGKYCMVGSGSVVVQNIPDHALVVGNPARIIGYVCECGFRLDVEGSCTECGEKFDTALLGEKR